MTQKWEVKQGIVYSEDKSQQTACCLLFREGPTKTRIFIAAGQQLYQ